VVPIRTYRRADETEVNVVLSLAPRPLRHSNYSDGNTGCDETVLDRRGCGFVLQEEHEYLCHILMYPSSDEPFVKMNLHKGF
jgi:hypothetical protein